MKDGATPVPEEVRVLLRDQLDSFEKLELALLLGADPGEAWSPFAAAERLGMSSSIAAASLEELRALALVELTPDGRYRHLGAPSPALDELGRIYGRDRLVVIEILNASALARIRGSAGRAFAEAFRLRSTDTPGKGGKDG